MAQVLSDIDNIKLPYPTEGVIRTAQLDDTVSPQNSAQLATNMNFDRVGAFQTRPGVTQYADDLVAAVNSYGTLHNEIVPPGFKNLTQLGSVEDLATSMKFPAAVKVSDTKVAIFWTDSDNHGFAQNLTIDETTGEIFPIGTAIEFESSFNSNNRAILVSSNFVLNVWTGAGNDGMVRIFDVSGDSIVAKDSALDFDSSTAQSLTLAIIDSTHVICFWASGVSGDGTATVFAVNLSTGAVTQPGSPLTFHAGPTSDDSCVAVGDGTHFINFWNGTTGGLAQTFSVNTGTWAITGIGTALIFDTLAEENNAITTGDGEHFVNIYRNSALKVNAQAFNMNLSTFAITTVGTPILVSATSGNDLTAVGFSDGQHFLAFYSSVLGTGFVQMIEMDPATFDMSLVGELLTGYDFANAGYTNAITLTGNKAMVVWGNVGGLDGQAAMFETFGDVIEGRWLYAGSGTEVFNTDDGTWVSRRTGLATVSKPRYSQFLNYIWMVNGNDQLGGDPVATSNGGNFGTDLVPTGFPKGDFIHGGFEGRVWVANKTLGVIYYTDIVQFTPPNVYTLTYNAQVNFITTIAPQTGETFTALFEVPRSLLVFTQNTITRIYGASSLDAYPAYNVGTYSQESIVQTKTGIFFHHSSGFYQFDYGSQPIEISRRIIDFVQAIPRANYENITGVWDGFDNVEWAIGQVVVEGVIFANCVVRYTISTQVWTIYDYVGNNITAMIFYDDGVNLNHLMGTLLGKTGAMDVGDTDFGAPFYYEFIDRWRSLSEMYYLTKRIDAVSVYHENAAGANLLYQNQEAGPNAWKPLGPITSESNSIVPNGNSDDFNVMRLRIVGTTKGVQIIIHGIELLQVTLKGQNKN